jgi:hypothetical protein
MKRGNSLNGVTKKDMGKGFGIDFSSVIMGWKGFKILPVNGAKNVITEFVVG